MQLPLLPPKLHRLLASDPDLQPVVAKAREIAALEALCRGFLPPVLASQVRAVIPKDRGLVVVAAHSAAAAKLKLLSESLSEFLMRQGWKVNSVSIRVQPIRAESEVCATHKKIALSPSGLAALESLCKRLADSPAREALRALIRHQGEARELREPTPSGRAGRSRPPARPPRARS